MKTKKIYFIKVDGWWIGSSWNESYPTSDFADANCYQGNPENLKKRYDGRHVEIFEISLNELQILRESKLSKILD